MYLIVACTQININMRCIEIALNAWVDSNYNMININMRCIEICPMRTYIMCHNSININMRCIEIQAERLLQNPLATD